ncbi:MAG: hypothetical protein AAGB05_03185 [Pseudomonadota bacterium]
MTYAAFVIYAALGWLFFSTMRLVYAIPATLVLGFLMLPSRFAINFPIVPSLQKDTMPALLTLFLILLFYRKANPHDRLAVHREKRASFPEIVLDRWWPRGRGMQGLLLAMFLVPIGTFVFNRAPVSWGPVTLPGLTPYATLSAIQAAIVTALALFLGRRFLADEKGHRALLLVLAIAGLILSVPTLAEVRLSPQLHNIVYGYFPHSFAQHIRDGGFRPLVFMDHALELSLFLCLSSLAIVGYMRAIDGDKRILYFFAAAYMVVVVFLSKSFGMVLVASALIPVLMFASARWQLMCAALVAAIVLTYPAMRAVGASPLSGLVEVIEPIAADRAGSLAYRLDAEVITFERAMEKPAFGWGGFGRAEIYDEDGDRLTARDGHWLITIGQDGLIGFYARYGLLCIPLLVLAWRSRRYEIGLATSGLCVLLAANIIDLVPNSGITPVTWLVVGALWGRIELGQAAQSTEEAPIQTGAPDAHSPTARPARGAVTRPMPVARRGASAIPSPDTSDGPLVARLRRRPPGEASPEDPSDSDPARVPSRPSSRTDPASSIASGRHTAAPVYSRFGTKRVRRPRTG